MRQNDIQIKVIMGFSLKNWEKLKSRTSNGYTKIGYDDVVPIMMKPYQDSLDLKKFDPIYGKIKYVEAFIYLGDLIESSFESMAYNRSSVIWETLISKELND